MTLEKLRFVFMSNKATAGGAADDEVSLKTRPQMVGFRGIGTLPTKQFSQKMCNRQAYYIACGRQLLTKWSFYELYRVALFILIRYNLSGEQKVLYFLIIG